MPQVWVTHLLTWMQKPRGKSMLWSQCLHRGQQQCTWPGAKCSGTASGCIFIWVSAEALPERCCEGGIPKRSNFLSHVPCRCCPGAMKRWETPLCPPQFPADGETDDVLRAQMTCGRQGPTRSCQHPWPRHVSLLQEPHSKLMLPAGPYPFSALCQPHMPGMRAQRWVSHLHAGFLSLHGTKPVPITPG